MARWRGLSVIVTAAILLAGCNAGLAISVGMKCSAQMTSSLGLAGTCHEELDELTAEAKRNISVQTVDVLPQVHLFINGEVQEGSFTFLVKDSSGKEVSQTARPERALDMHVVTRLDGLNTIAFRLNPGAAGAKGIKYEVAFQCECLP